MLPPHAWPLVGLLILTPPQTSAEIDRFWAEAERTVREGDFQGYAKLYHDDAVIVNGMSGRSDPIFVALAAWKQGFEDTAAGLMTADVEFRFTRRLHGESTAHETGIFRYSAQPEGEEGSVALIHFQALLVRVDGEWKWVMEYQAAEATEEEWEAAG